MITLRSNRILILALALVICSTFYLFYPSDHFLRPHTPLDPYNTYVSGGIDSDHYQDPVIPDFGDEEIRAAEDVCTGPGCEEDTRHHNPPTGVDKGSIRRPTKGDKEIAHKPLDEVIDETRMEDEQARGTTDLNSSNKAGSGKSTNTGLVLEDNVLSGGVIMPKLENATAKAELGRAAWRVLHLMTLRYPENPTPDDRTALKSYFHLFSRLYPCGECAEEFQNLLKEYPPQTSSRKTASMWLCSVHNIINDRLGKPEFDCLTLNDVYDCGCGPEGDDKAGTAEKSESKVALDDKPAVKANKPLGGMRGKEKNKGNVASEEGSRHESGQYSAGGGVNAAADVKAWSVKEATKQGSASAKEEVKEAIYHPPKKETKEKAAEVALPATKDDLLSIPAEGAGIEAVYRVDSEDENTVGLEQDEQIVKEVVGLDEEADEDDSGVLGSVEHDGALGQGL